MRILCIPLFLAAAQCFAQESPFLSSFRLTDLEGAVRLDWVMTSGSTCVGTDILRSEDSLNFAVVGRFDELCGHVSQPTPYDFTDEEAPDFITLFYRLKLGLNGYSSIQRVHHVRSGSEAIHLFPVPAEEDLTVVVRASSQATVRADIFTSDGRHVAEYPDLMGPVNTVDLQRLPAGAYFLRARWDGQEAVERFVVR